MPVICRYKPRRTKLRRYSIKDAGRIVCLVAGTPGNSMQALRKELEKCAPCQEQRRPTPEASAAAAIEQAAIGLQDGIQTFAVAVAVIAAILVIVRFGALVIPFAAGAGLRLAVSQLLSVQGRLVVQQAANQAQYQILRNTAANQAFYQRLANAGL